MSPSFTTRMTTFTLVAATASFIPTAVTAKGLMEHFTVLATGEAGPENAVSQQQNLTGESDSMNLVQTRYFAQDNNNSNNKASKCCPSGADLAAGISSCLFCGCLTFWVKMLCIYPCYDKCATSGDGSSCSCNFQCCSVLNMAYCTDDGTQDALAYNSASPINPTEEKRATMTKSEFAKALIGIQVLDSATVGLCYGIENCYLSCCQHACGGCVTDCVCKTVANLITCAVVSIWEIFSYGIRIYGPCCHIECTTGCCETGTSAVTTTS